MTAAKLRAWFLLARPPFHSVGLLPFLAGSVMAVSDGYSWRWPVFLLGAACVCLIMLATYLLGEYYDFPGDSLNANRNPFSGGSGVLQSCQLIPRRHVLVAGYLAGGGAVFLGLALHLAFGIGRPALLLGAVGLVGGMFYSARPFQWAYRSVGEGLIGFCYGWLTVNMGYYILAGKLTALGTLVCLPVALSITAVILINEFPDLEADAATGKRNLVVLMGLDRAARLYVGLIVGSAASVWLAVWSVAGLTWPWLLGPVLVSSAATLAVRSVARGRHRHPRTVVGIMAATIGLNLLINLYYVVLFSFA